MRLHAKKSIAVGLCAWLSTAGCQYLADTNLPRLEPPPVALVQPTVEHSVGQFTYAMRGNDPKPSTIDGKLLGKEIMRAWRKRGFIREDRYVKKRAFSGNADYNLTLSGTQHNDVSFFGQVLSALTLLIAPYTVTQTYDLHCLLEDTHSGAQFTANVQATDQTQIEIFLLVTLPLTWRGHDSTMQRVADHIYNQLQHQGAFQPLGGTPPVEQSQSPRTATRRAES